MRNILQPSIAGQNCRMTPDNGANGQIKIGQNTIWGQVRSKTRANWPRFRVLAAEGQLNQRGLWSGRWESNPCPKLGNLNIGGLRWV